MANKKFSEFVLKTDTSGVSHIVGYNGAENVQITPANFVTTGGTGVFLPLVGGTMIGNTTVIDGKKIIFGTSPGNDLQIYHDGSDSYIQDTSGTGDLIIDTNVFRLRSANGGESMITAFEDSSVNLMFNSFTKLSTTNTGIDVSGTITSNIAASGNNVIATLNNTDFTANNRSALKIRQQATAGGSFSAFLGANQDGSIFLSNDSITADHLTISNAGNATFAGSVTLPDTVQFKGTTYSSSFLSFWNDTTLSASDDIIFAATGGVEKMRLTSTGLGIGTSSASQKLHVSGNMRLTGGFRDRLNSQGAANYVLTSTGSNGTQWVDASNSSIIGGPYLPTAGGTMTGVTQFNDHTQYGDQVQARFGASNDLVIEHNGGNSFINDVGTGNLLITSNGVSVQINKGLTENMAEFITDGAVKLYYDSVKKFETTSSGISVTGSINVDGDSGDTAEFRGATQSTVNFKAGSVNNYLVATTTGTLSFRPNGSTSTTMLANGNVGIGTSAPTAKIQISGTNANNKIVSYFDGNFVSGFKFSDLNGGIWYDAGADDLYLSAAQANSQMIFEVAGSERMRVDSSGFIYVNTGGAEPSASQVGVKITGTQGQAFWSSANTGTSGYNHFNFYNSNGAVGSIVTNGSATAFNTSSDYRLKEDLQDFKGLDMVSKIPVYDFKWKVDESRSYGVMAHELEEVLPQAVSGDKDAKEMQSVDYSKIVPLLVKSIQELKAEIELLKK